MIYNAVDFLPKNRDTFSTNLKQCMLNSENEFINDLFAAEPGADGQISRYAHKGLLIMAKSSVSCGARRFPYLNMFQQSHIRLTKDKNY